jgi:hypothetical protein
VEHLLMGEDRLAAILEDMAERVRDGDSFEGSVEYLMPGPLGLPAEDDQFAVQAAYRVGNTDGQGSIRLIRRCGAVEEGSPPPGLGPRVCLMEWSHGHGEEPTPHHFQMVAPGDGAPSEDPSEERLRNAVHELLDSGIRIAYASGMTMSEVRGYLFDAIISQAGR